MDPIAIYLLKMMTCSAVLFGYYRMALYDKKFHAWNRFYHLAAITLSVVLPFITIPLAVEPSNGKIVHLIGGLPWNLQSSKKELAVTWQEATWYLCILVSAFMLVKILVGITKILIDYRRNPVQPLSFNVSLILTSLKEAPFSFFNWLFWRNDIDPASENGSRIMAHELAHIRQHHSVDKLFTSTLLAVFWVNPFFWLIRKELYIIHEFLADRKAIEQNNTEAFAQMILQALPVNTPTNSLTNPFFSSQIKRRLIMITTSENTTYSYLRRLSGLVLMAGAAIIVTLSVQQSNAQQPAPRMMQKEKNIEKKITDTTQKKVDEKIIIKKADKEFKKDGTTKTIIIEKKVINGDKVTITSHEDEIDDEAILHPNGKNPPLYIVDGKEVKAEDIKKIDPSAIKTVDVFKGEKAIEEYGEKAKNGVVIISTGKGDMNSATPSKVKIKIKTGKVSPVFYLDGKEITSAEMNDIKPNDIESVNVLKGESATKKYGAKGNDGVVEIVMKKPAV